MPRKLKRSLLTELKTGKYKLLLDYIKSDHELCLEVRNDGRAHVYYRKGVAIIIGPRKLTKADKNYGNVPSPSIAQSDPSEYFNQIKKAINNWLNEKKERAEFDTQQNISAANQEEKDRFLIIDMEYRFEQGKIEAAQTKKGATFDLLGIERNTGRIIFFEVKTGLLSTEGSSGIDSHIEDFDDIWNSGKNINKKIFMDNLINDVKNIISDKMELGIITNFKIPESLNDLDPELIFIFHPMDESEVDKFDKKLAGQKEMITVQNGKFKLK